MIRPSFASAARAIFVLGLFFASGCSRPSETSGDFIRWMNSGKSQYEAGQIAPALEAFNKAAALDPSSLDARHNLAAALLRAGRPEDALRETGEILKRDPTSASALYLAGCAQLRQGRAEPALKLFQQVKEMDRTINPVSYQLGRAHQLLGQFEEARKQFEEVIEFDPGHPAAHYSLSQVLQRLNRAEEATRAIERHQQILAARTDPSNDAYVVEKCVYTAARAPFILEQPDAKGIAVRFFDATAQALGPAASHYRAPLALLDTQQQGTQDLFVRDAEGFRLLSQAKGVFTPRGPSLPAPSTLVYRQALVGDLDNDRYEDVIVLGEKSSHVFRFATNAQVRETTAFIGLKDLTGSSGLLADLDFTGKLDLLSFTPADRSPRVHRNLGNYFTTRGVTSGPPATLQGIAHPVLDDWNNDDLPDLWLVRDQAPPQLLLKQRGGGYLPTNAIPDLPHAVGLMSADFNNDLHSDLLLLSGKDINLWDGTTLKRTVIAAGLQGLTHLGAFDYDNDGWLDIAAWGRGLRVWRNLGQQGFKEMTSEAGLSSAGGWSVAEVKFADLDGDGDTDAVAALSEGGLKLLRNEGGNANLQLKLRLLGNRSNASGLGHRVELIAGGLRVARFIRELPVEIGVGQHKMLETLTVKWSDLAPPIVDVAVTASTVLPIVELQSPTGSCPYLYAWDGSRFRFVTDLLGAAPVGLPVADGRYIQADTSEWVWIGDSSQFQPKNGDYVLQITEELREVLYLDQALLAVVDHQPGTEVHPSNKLMPGPPFPAAELVTVGKRRPLLGASRLSGENITSALAENDGKVVSPEKLRGPQLRGMAEPFGMELDFGELPPGKPWVLAMTGWLRFGGGMANMSASRHEDFPFPFPTLEAEVSGIWKPVDVTVGAPAGKTKSILVDLENKLPPGTRKLRLTMAFELHWDRIALFEKMASAETRITRVNPHSTDLHWRGYSEFEDRPWFEPLTPDYRRVKSQPDWRLSITGWCTRYGEVDRLVSARDDALVVMNGGDELTLRFSTAHIPPGAPGTQRNFFLFTDGWDKDADYHVKRGQTVDPLPFHGMDDQRYGSQPRPRFPNDEWMEQTRTRWTGPWNFARRNPRASAVP